MKINYNYLSDTIENIVFPFVWRDSVADLTALSNVVTPVDGESRIVLSNSNWYQYWKSDSVWHNISKVISSEGMTKGVYDTNNNNIADKAESIDDGAGNTATASNIKDAVTKKHTQGTDTTLGALSANVDANSHKITGLSVPSSNGDSIRATTKITEANLEDAVDKKHTTGTDTALGTLTTKDPLIDADLIIARNSVTTFSLVTNTCLQFWTYLKGKADALYLALTAKITTVNVEDAVDKKHSSNADTGLNIGGSNPITAKEIVDPKYLIGDITAQGGLKNEILSKDVGLSNLLLNGSFENFSAGSSVDPDNWILTGGGSVARSATAKIGSYSVALTSDANGNQLYQTFSTDIYYQDRTLILLVWVKASDAGVARIQCWDNVIGFTSSSWHTGGGAWELLICPMQVSSTATELRVYLQNAGNTKVVYFDGAMMVEGCLPFAFTPHPKDVNADLNMGNHQVTALSVPDANGEAIRQTSKITEVLLESATDLKHTQNTDTDLDATFEATFVKYLDTQFAIVAFSRDTAVASGIQAVTGVGFKPRAVFFFMCKVNTTEASWGFDTGITQHVLAHMVNGTFRQHALFSIYDYYLVDVAEYYGEISSMDSDGFTVSWIRGGAPTGVINVFAVCLK